MKALVATGYGQPESLCVTEVETPAPGAGQILVRISVATINPTDIRAIAGDLGNEISLQFPYTLGNDFAGTVVAAGKGVVAFTVGDEVFGQALPRSLGAFAAQTRPSLSTGALAEFAVFEADTPLIARRPPTVSPEQAAALATGGLTARAVLLTAAVIDSETVLVIGATGSVGTVLIPLLARTGAIVIATAKTPEDAKLLLHLGATRTIGFDPTNYPTGVDAVFNLVAPADRVGPIAATLRQGGRLISIMYPPASPEQLRRHDITQQFVMDLAGELGGMSEVAQSAAQGTLRATIAGRYSLADGVQAAVAFARDHTLGKIVVAIPGTSITSESNQ
jgi:NADPH2:quinone reductase